MFVEGFGDQYGEYGEIKNNSEVKSDYDIESGRKTFIGTEKFVLRDMLT